MSENGSCAFRRADGQFCRRKVQGDQKYCWQHAHGFANKLRSLSRNQRLIFVVTVVGTMFTVIGFGLQWLDRNRQPDIVPREPVIDLAIGEPFGSTTLIMLANNGPESVVNVEINLRCFLLRSATDVHPDLLFDGFPSVDNSHSWWMIPTLEQGQKRTNEARDAVDRYLHNMEVMEASAGRLLTKPSVHRMIFAVVISYQRRSDSKRDTVAGVAELFKDSQSRRAFLVPLSMSDFYRELLKNVTAPGYRVG